MKILILIFHLGWGSFFENVNKLNETCPDQAEKTLCEDDCDDGFQPCMNHCGLEDCYLQCANELHECKTKCPCNAGCPQGCLECENPACFCSSNPSPENEFNLDLCLKYNSVQLGECLLEHNGVNDLEKACYETFKHDNKKCPCQDECKRGCPCDPDVFPCQDIPTTPAPITTTTTHETTTADWFVTTSWLNDTSTTPIDIYDWRQIMGDKLDILQILAITELVLAFIIYVSGLIIITNRGCLSFWSLYTLTVITVNIASPALGIASLYKDLYEDETNETFILYQSYICMTVILVPLHGLSLWISFCYRIYQEMVLPLFRKCCPQRPNRVDIESTELQTNPTIHNEAQTDCGPKINPQRCSALVQMALAETVNELGSTDLGSKLSGIINSVEFQNFMDELMEFVKTRSPEQLTYTVNSSNQLKKTEELAVNVELKRRMHEKIFYLGDKRLTAIRTIANQTTEQAPAVNIRTTIGSTSASIADGDQKESESDKDERDSVFPLLTLCGVLMVPLYATTIAYGWTFAFEDDAANFP